MNERKNPKIESMKIERKNGNREGWGEEERPGDRETERREGGGEDIHQDESESDKRSNETKRIK